MTTGLPHRPPNCCWGALRGNGYRSPGPRPRGSGRRKRGVLGAAAPPRSSRSAPAKLSPFGLRRPPPRLKRRGRLRWGRAGAPPAQPGAPGGSAHFRPRRRPGLGRGAFLECGLRETCRDPDGTRQPGVGCRDAPWKCRPDALLAELQQARGACTPVAAFLRLRMAEPWLCTLRMAGLSPTGARNSLTPSPGQGLLLC